MTLEQTMKRLYDSEINCGMESFWDGGFRVWIGDEMNGHQAEENFDDENLDAITPWLLNTAARIYPDSDFAKSFPRPTDEQSK